MTDGFYRILSALLGDTAVPCSGVSGRTETQLRPLLDSGAVARVRRGRGMVYESRDVEAIRSVHEQRFPHGDGTPSGPDGSAPPRSEAVAMYRDAKRAHRSTAEPVLVRAVTSVRASRGGHTVDLLTLTAQTGAACLLVDDGPGWHIEGVIAVVENLEVFLHFERLGTDAALAIYAGGRLSRRVLDWLSSRVMAQCVFLHCGDYDPVGLDEYVRLREKLKDRVSLHVPRDLSFLLRRYGKRALLADSTAILHRLRSVDLPPVRAIVELMDATGCGLEQEALLLTSSVEC